MSHRFVRCPHCRMPHHAADRVCPTTGKRIDPASIAPRAPKSPPVERGSSSGRSARDLARPAEATKLPRGAPRSSAFSLVGRTLSERYVIKGVLGAGGMGTVYDAEHVGLGRSVAIKVLNPVQAKKGVAVKRFHQEARAAGAIGHPNICEVYDLGLLDDGSPYLVMERLVGTTLADRIANAGRLPLSEVENVMGQVLAGLVAAHAKGIAHRDIKPENIFLAHRPGYSPIAKILDFGVSKVMATFQGTTAESLDLTRTGMVMGTPYYMSPEQARGERDLDGQVDVYACGVMMYEALVGRRPFLAPNYNALLVAIINTTPRSICELRPSIPASVEALIAKMMAKSRALRHASAAAALHDLNGLRRAKNAKVPARSRGPVPVAVSVPASIPIPSGLESGRRRGGGGSAPRERVENRLARLASAGVTIRGSLADLPALAGGGDAGGELPTEVYRPGKRAVSRDDGAGAKGGDTSGRHARLRARPGMALPSPLVDLAEPGDDDGEGATQVVNPRLSTSFTHSRPPKGAFTQEDTVNLEGSVDVEFSDETAVDVRPPARRSR